MSREMLEYDRDSLRDEVAFLNRHVAGIREELRLAEADLAEKECLLTEAVRQLEENDEPAIIIG